MAFNNKKAVVEPVYADRSVWQCTSCTCWSRQEYVTSDSPDCPICNSKMTQEIRNIRIE